jgi:hypothetical protein
MGSEDLFHKKRERSTNDLKRNTATRNNPTRQPQPRILIVCEDSKSSAYYLEELAKDLGLNAVTVEGKRCGSAPSSVFAFTKQQYDNSVKDRNAYDRVYCVFDRDQHTCFDATVQAIADMKSKDTFFAITTTPCFEFWLLLHFDYSSQAYNVTGNKSPCDNAHSDLQKKWADYAKSKRGVYANTRDQLATAITNAKQLAIENLKTGSTNPQTNMHELIEYLQSIKR